MHVFKEENSRALNKRKEKERFVLTTDLHDLFQDITKSLISKS